MLVASHKVKRTVGKTVLINAYAGAGTTYHFRDMRKTKNPIFNGNMEFIYIYVFAVSLVAKLVRSTFVLENP